LNVGNVCEIIFNYFYFIFFAIASEFFEIGRTNSCKILVTWLHAKTSEILIRSLKLLVRIVRRVEENLRERLFANR
jgi:hypothetical protein